MSKQNESSQEKAAQAAPAVAAKKARPRVYSVSPGHSVFCRIGNVMAGGNVSAKQFPGGETEIQKLISGGFITEQK